MFTIEKSVPLPTKGKDGRNAGMQPHYPFGAMQIGDSFVSPKDRQKLVRAAASLWKRRHPGWDFTTRVEGEAMRLWRTA